MKEVCVRQMRGENELVPTRLMAIATVIFHQLAHDGALWMPHSQTATELLRERQQVLFNGKTTMIALFSFNQAIEVFFQCRF